MSTTPLANPMTLFVSRWDQNWDSPLQFRIVSVLNCRTYGPRHVQLHLFQLMHGFRGPFHESSLLFSNPFSFYGICWISPLFIGEQFGVFIQLLSQICQQFCNGGLIDPLIKLGTNLVGSDQLSSNAKEEINIKRDI